MAWVRQPLTRMTIVRGPAVSPELSSSLWPHVLLRYLAVVGVSNLVWEFVQMPLYTIWQTSSGGSIAYAAVHCWVGDLLIAASCLGIAILTTNRNWPIRHYGRTAVLATALGVISTILLEWLNVDLLQNWAYAPSMPVLPLLGTGLSPLLQWLILPPVAFAWARSREAELVQ